MLIAIISDIHSNADALNAVLEEINKIKPDLIFCAGDIVGYGPEPQLCIEIIRDLNIETVGGNHDFACAGLVDINTLSESAREAIIWTQTQIDEDDLSFLAELPLLISNDYLSLSHASFSSPELFEYILTPLDVERSLDALNKKIGFIGHSHTPIIYHRDEKGRINTIKSKEYQVSDGKIIVNVGSVGQPRDFNPSSCFVLFDVDKNKVIYKRVNYNYKATYQKMLDNNLPKNLAERLFFGI